MELLGSFNFFLYAGVVAVPALILGFCQKNIKYYGLAATLFFVFMAMQGNKMALFYLGAYCLIQLFLVKTYLILNKKYGRNQYIYWVYVLLSLGPLITSKLTGITGDNIFAFLGISYMTFKSVQIIIEIYDELIEEVKVFDFLYLLLFFPVITSGPIDRSRRFNEDLNVTPTREEYATLVGKGLYKILLGMVYKFVLASIFYQIETRLGMEYTMKSAFIYMYSYGFYLFFDFAGYSNMAIGLSYIFGIKSPENFNKPFISKDITEFWDRWHISLSHWFRDFIFTRLMMRAIKEKWFKSKLTRASFGFIVNMGIMGIWHGLGIEYILYGLYHGVLLALTEVYQKKFKFHKKHKKEKWYQLVSWFVTFNLVMFGFFIFSGRFTFLLEKLYIYVM